MKNILFLFAFSIIFTSCSQPVDDNFAPIETKYAYDLGDFITQYENMNFEVTATDNSLPFKLVKFQKHGVMYVDANLASYVTGVTEINKYLIYYEIVYKGQYYTFTAAINQVNPQQYRCSFIGKQGFMLLTIKN